GAGHGDETGSHATTRAGPGRQNSHTSVNGDRVHPRATPIPVAAGGPALGWLTDMGAGRGELGAVRRQWRGEDLVHRAGGRVPDADAGARRDAVGCLAVGGGGD